jgi:hypothetical protein
VSALKGQGLRGGGEMDLMSVVSYSSVGWAPLSGARHPEEGESRGGVRSLGYR